LTFKGQTIAVDMGSPRVPFPNSLLDSLCRLAMRFAAKQKVVVFCLWTDARSSGDSFVQAMDKITKVALQKIWDRGHSSATWHVLVIKHVVVRAGSSAKNLILSDRNAAILSVLGK